MTPRPTPYDDKPVLMRTVCGPCSICGVYQDQLVCLVEPLRLVCWKCAELRNHPEQASSGGPVRKSAQESLPLEAE